MNYRESRSAPPDFRVLTRIYPHGRSKEIESVVPLHPKVKAYLEQRADFLHFEIHDRARYSFCIYNSEEFLRREIYYVPYWLTEQQPMMLGAGTVMIFDQMTGELLYEGTDGGE